MDIGRVDLLTYIYENTEWEGGPAYLYVRTLNELWKGASAYLYKNMRTLNGRVDLFTSMSEH